MPQPDRAALLGLVDLNSVYANEKGETIFFKVLS